MIERILLLDCMLYTFKPIMHHELIKKKNSFLWTSTNMSDIYVSRLQILRLHQN